MKRSSAHTKGDGTNECRRFDKEGQWYEITGILSRYDSVQLLPRKQEDLRKLDGAAHPPPAAEGEYESVVERVVRDKLSILKEPVLGSTKFTPTDTQLKLIISQRIR